MAVPVEWLDDIPLWLLIVLSLTLGLAPFYPKPHLWEKLKMLLAGNLMWMALIGA